MKISITDHEASILRQSLKSNIMAEGILEKIDSAQKLQEEKHECEHKFGEYTGKRQCCVKCGSLDIGMGESWILEKFLEETK